MKSRKYEKLLKKSEKQANNNKKHKRIGGWELSSTQEKYHLHAWLSDFGKNDRIWLGIRIIFIEAGPFWTCGIT